MDIVEFLKARLDEDEREARLAQRIREATPLQDPRRNTQADYDLSAYEDIGVPTMLIGPERVLREVKAKRRIVELHDTVHECVWPGGQAGMDAVACPTLRHIAAVYADHPDYDPEWAD